MRVEAPDQLVLSGGIDGERHMIQRLRCRREQLGMIVGFGELKERERRTVGEREEGVAVLPLLPAQVLLLAPGRNERHSQDGLVKMPCPFLVGNHVRVVMQMVPAALERLRRAPFVVAVVLVLFIVLIETAARLLTKGHALVLAGGDVTAGSASRPPGRAIAAIGLLDAVLLFATAMFAVGVVGTRRLQGR